MTIRPETERRSWLQRNLLRVCLVACASYWLGLAAYLIFGLR
jgi:hypothetical protein